MLNLTYDNDHLPEHGQLVKSDLQDFFKRLRKNTGPFRYVASGEYGELSRRPHFHIALFGMDFADTRNQWGESINGDQMYISSEVRRSWKLGGHTIGELNFESAAYIARYIMGKIKGVGATPLPLYRDSETGEIIFPNEEFLIMSKGIGKRWFNRHFMTDIYPHAACVTSQGTWAPVPRYYKELLKEVGTDLAFDMSARTLTRMSQDVRTFSDVQKKYHEDMNPRREARAAYNKARTSIFKREIKE